MLFDRVIGNLRDLDLDLSAPLDVIDLPWDQCALPAIRGTTRNGKSIGIIPPRGRSLRDGDVLGDATNVDTICVQVPPVECWVATFSDPSARMIAALELGNLHVPVEVDGDAMVIVPDGPTREVLDRLEATVVAATRVFAPLRVTVLQGVKLAKGFKVVPNRGR